MALLSPGQESAGQATNGIKLCVSCLKDVTHERRMRDAEGRYWCVACGKEDSKRKHSGPASTHQHAVGMTCMDCHGKYPTEKMVRDVRDEWVCVGCHMSREKERRARHIELGDEGPSKSLIGMPMAIGLAVVGVAALVGGIIWASYL